MYHHLFLKPLKLSEIVFYDQCTENLNLAIENVLRWQVRTEALETEFVFPKECMPDMEDFDVDFLGVYKQLIQGLEYDEFANAELVPYMKPETANDFYLYFHKLCEVLQPARTFERGSGDVLSFAILATSFMRSVNRPTRLAQVYNGMAVETSMGPETKDWFWLTWDQMSGDYLRRNVMREHTPFEMEYEAFMSIDWNTFILPKNNTPQA
ncbi:MAG: hypothetical protein ABIF40_02210 [archaeon]